MTILTEEQTMLRHSARDWVRKKAPVSAFRALRDSGNPDGFDRAAWREMCELGWAGIVIPEESGGSGLGYRTLGLVLEELGRTLTASPLLSSTAAASALLLDGGAEQKQRWLPKLADGSAIGTLAVDEGAHHAPEKIELIALKTQNGYTLSGTKRFVPDGGIADFFVVAARTNGTLGDKYSVSLFLVDETANGISRDRLQGVDSRGYANLTFANTEVPGSALLVAADDRFDLLEATLDRARACLAAEMLGAATQSFEITLDYLKTRVQFGQLIGTFQALQHRAAKMYTELELTRSCVYAALGAIDGNAKDTPALCSLAKARANDIWHLVSNEMVQMHGGIGMTDAHDAGLYLKRARVAEVLFGSSAFHRDRYATLMGY
jgi:alkylation response protein AidB-like acyl-CoA dehydrogenase